MYQTITRKYNHQKWVQINDFESDGNLIIIFQPKKETKKSQKVEFDQLLKSDISEELINKINKIKSIPENLLHNI